MRVLGGMLAKLLAWAMSRLRPVGVPVLREGARNQTCGDTSVFSWRLRLMCPHGTGFVFPKPWIFAVLQGLFGVGV